MTKINVSVSVDDSHLGEILEIAQHLQAKGFEVEQIMDKIGIITGFCDDGLLGNLSQLTGVSQVEQQQTYQLPPPASEIQ